MRTPGPRAVQEWLWRERGAKTGGRWCDHRSHRPTLTGWSIQSTSTHQFLGPRLHHLVEHFDELRDRFRTEVLAAPKPDRDGVRRQFLVAHHEDVLHLLQL